MTGELNRRPKSTHIGGLRCVKTEAAGIPSPTAATRSYARKVSFVLRAFSCDPL